MKATKGLCARCGSRRPLKLVRGPGLHPKGVEMCRGCNQGYKMALRLKGQFAVGKAAPHGTQA